MLRRGCSVCGALRRSYVDRESLLVAAGARHAFAQSSGSRLQRSSRLVASSSALPLLPASLARGYATTAVAAASEEPDSAEEPAGIVLRPYQQEAIDACLDALRDGKTRIGVSSPTGSGKTTIFTHLIPQIQAKRGIRGQVLILVGNIELANQALAAVRRSLPELSVELEQSKNKASGYADVTIATYQTMNNDARKEKFDPSQFKLVIVDEAHHAAANSYLRLLNYFNHHVALPIEASAPPHKCEVPIIGFSATFSRPDQLALNLVFEEIVFHQEVSHMLREGWLSPARVTTLKVDLNLAAVTIGRDGDFLTSSLAMQVNTPKVNKMVVGVYLDQIAERRSTLVFCVDLTHVTALANAFREAGVDARIVSSKTRPSERRQLVEDFRAGVFPIMVNCEIFTEGTDIPEIDSIIITRPTRSRNLLAQMVGRGLRLSPNTGKIDCRLIDVVDSVGRANGMVAVPTLFGLSLEEKEARDLEEREVESFPVKPKAEVDPRRVTYIEHDDPFGVDLDTVPVLQKMSPNAWVACGKGKYILELMFDRGYVTIMRETPALYSILYTPRLPEGMRTKSPNGRTMVVAQAPDFDRALQTADAFAARRVPRDMALISIRRSASWRQRPPTEKALLAIAKMKRVPTETAEGVLPDFINIGERRVELKKLTGGQVAAFMTAARHGALGIRSRNDKVEARAEAKAQAEEDKRQAALARAVPVSKRVT